MSYFAGTSPRRLARVAGALYLVNIIGGAFAIAVVPAVLSTSDPATAVANIQAHELLYRCGLAAHLVVALTNVPLGVLFYELFAVVNRRLAQLVASFLLVGAAIEAAGLLDQFTPLVLLGDRYASALPANQLQALTQLSGDLSSTDYTIHTLFFAGYVICLARLVLRSAFVPRTIGVLLAIDGLAYGVHTFTDLLTPTFAVHLVPWINAPALLGEGSLCLWLLVVGIDIEPWKAWAGPSIYEPAARSGPPQDPAGRLPAH
jgi:hypothetical protein